MILRDFEKQKKAALQRADNSRKGSIDKRILNLVNALNRSGNFYTTSSCSGRIMLLVPGRDKRSTQWLFVTHEPVSLQQLQNALSSKLPKKEIWLRQEAMILHACCRNLDDASRLLLLSKSAGFRRSGIIALNGKIVVEIVGSAHFETIVAASGKIVADRKLLKLLMAAANKRLKKNFAMIKKFEKEMKIPTTQG